MSRCSGPAHSTNPEDPVGASSHLLAFTENLSTGRETGT